MLACIYHGLVPVGSIPTRCSISATNIGWTKAIARTMMAQCHVDELVKVISGDPKRQVETPSIPLHTHNLPPLDHVRLFINQAPIILGFRDGSSEVTDSIERKNVLVILH
jgi:hypothetical protein